MKILAIETSCDDTGIAILSARGGPASGGEADFNVLSNIVSSQIKVHKKYGGVYPAMAKREHQRNLVPVLTRALKQAELLKIHPVIRQGALSNDRANSKLQTILERESELLKKLIPFLKKYEKPDIDLIAVTQGPGLEPCLWVGVNFAKALSCFWNIPIVPVNHIESHILVNFLDNPKIEFPAIALVVSGGHTQLILMRGIGKYKILGETRDDAAGECFDKCAKILGLPYPGGPIISKLAAKTVRARSSDSLPRPMFNTKDYDFSFSGLKTAVLYAWQKAKPRDRKFCSSKIYDQLKIKMAAEIQQAIIDVLIKKTMKAVKDYKAKTLMLGGGVSANKELKKQFLFKIQNSKFKIHFLVPPKNLSTDNALMTAITGYFHKKEKVNPSASSGRFSRKIEAEANLRIS